MTLDDETIRIKPAPENCGRGWSPRFHIDEELGKRYDHAGYLLQQGDYQRALPIAVRLERIFPEHPYIVNLVGSILAQMDQDTEALQKFERALHHAPLDERGLQSLLWTNVGSAQLKLGDVASSQDSYQTAIEFDPTEPGAFINFGLICGRQKKWMEAIPFLEAAVDLACAPPGYPNIFSGAILMLAQCYKKTGQTDKMVKALGLSRGAPPDHAYISSKGRVRFYNRERDG